MTIPLPISAAILLLGVLGLMYTAFYSGRYPSGMPPLVRAAVLLNMAIIATGATLMLGGHWQ